MTTRLIIGDCRQELAKLAAGSVHCVVTSPPYLGLRSYGIGAENGEMGSEATPTEFVVELVAVFRELRRVLRDDGTIWLNLGSSYASGGKNASLSRQPPHAPTYDSGGKEPQDCSDLDCACRDLDGARRVGSRIRHGRSARTGQFSSLVDRPPSPKGRGSARLGCAQASPVGEPHADQRSNILSSSRHEPAACGPTGEALLSPKSRPTCAGGSKQSSRKSACTIGTGSRKATSSQGKSGKASSRLACDCGSCGICWANLAIPFLRFKGKDLMSIPHLVALAMQADGWYLRSDIIWAKPNAMPESVVDRPTSAHEHLFLLTKQPDYFYDAEAIKVARASDEDAVTFRGGSYVESQIDNQTLGKRTARGNRKVRGTPPRHAQYESSTRDSLDDVGRGGMRNARNVWTIATVPYKEAHFATFPPALAEPCVKAGTSARGCCPTCGTGWRRVVSKETAWASNAALAGTEIAGKGHPSEQVRSDHDVRDGPVSDTRTLGFYPACRCYKDLPPLGPYPAKPIKGHFPAKYLAQGLADWQAVCAEIDKGREARCKAASSFPVRPAVVLDPFAGAGTVGLVASRLQRHSVLIELNPASAELARSRLQKDGGLFVKIES